jgi:hypothetical protein
VNLAEGRKRESNLAYDSVKHSRPAVGQRNQHHANVGFPPIAEIRLKASASGGHVPNAKISARTYFAF